MEPYLITVDSQGRGTFKHDGEEFLHILEGVLEFTFGGEKVLVKPGDSLYFDSGVEHSGKSAGHRKGRMLCIIYNYRRS